MAIGREPLSPEFVRDVQQAAANPRIIEDGRSITGESVLRLPHTVATGSATDSTHATIAQKISPARPDRRLSVYSGTPTAKAFIERLDIDRVRQGSPGTRVATASPHGGFSLTES